MKLQEVDIRIVPRDEDQRFQNLMQEHHYLGTLPKIGETLNYVATLNEQWIALLSCSSPALKCSPRDRWIGWDFRHQYDRLKLLTNSSRFLILPDWHIPNLGSRILSLCQHRLPLDWQKAFGHPLVLLETFVDPERFQGTIYKAANWIYVGYSKGFHRTRQGYGARTGSRKMVFVKPFISNVQALLSQPVLEPPYRIGGTKIMLSAQQMKSLPYFFKSIPDPRRAQGLRHPLPTVLAIAAAATLCGMRGYLAISDWAQGLSQKARERFGCRCENRRYIVPSMSIIRDVLIRVEPADLDHALQQWNQAYALEDGSLAIDGKTMKNAIDEQGYQAHIMSVVGHQTKTCYTQKEIGSLPVEGNDELKRTNEIKTAIPLLDSIDIEGKTITADALLTQRQIADYLVRQRQSNYHFTVKNNQPSLFEDISLHFQNVQNPDYVQCDPPDHGRIEIRKIWVTTDLNEYLNFPHVGQAFMVQREATNKKTGAYSCETAYGITSHTPDQADPKTVLDTNRGHWSIENSCHYIIDWNFDEDRGRISKGNGPSNVTRLRRFAISLIKSKGVRSVAQKMRQLTQNIRAVFDYLRMTQSSVASA